VNLKSIPFRLVATIASGFIFALALVPVALASSTDPVINTTSGSLQGTVGASTIQYLGIPYAAAPVGSLRWMPTQPYGTWSGIFQAITAGARCPQLEQGSTTVVIGNENCLFLNVYTPRGKNSTKPHNLAVMVWIHGGGLDKGVGSDYDPTPMVTSGDVIVVTFNYRLGLLGFFAEQALDNEGHQAANYGLMDQQFALQWVKNNIAAFGGDPTRITVFGESAGGLSVYSQLASPLAAGLFDRAIAQSGAYAGFAPDYRPFVLPIATAESTGYETFVQSGAASASAAGCPNGDAACLRAANYKNIVLALGNYTPYPVIDGTLLTQTPGDAFASGNFNQVPVITGNNHDEYRYFVGEFNPKLSNTQAAYDGATGAIFGSIASSVEAEYPYPTNPPAAEAELLLSAAATDGIFVCPARTAESSLAKYVTVWAYEFADENAPIPPPPYPTTDFPLGAYHSADVQYFFDKGTIQPETPQAQLSAAMISYWTEFAKKGNPNSTAALHWDPYAANAQKRQFFSGSAPTVETGPEFNAFHMCSSYWGTL